MIRRGGAADSFEYIPPFFLLVSRCVACACVCVCGGGLRCGCWHAQHRVYLTFGHTCHLRWSTGDLHPKSTERALIDRLADRLRVACVPILLLVRPLCVCLTGEMKTLTRWWKISPRDISETSKTTMKMKMISCALICFVALRDSSDQASLARLCNRKWQRQLCTQARFFFPSTLSILFSLLFETGRRLGWEKQLSKVVKNHSTSHLHHFQRAVKDKRTSWRISSTPQHSTRCCPSCLIHQAWEYTKNGRAPIISIGIRPIPVLF